MRRNSLIKIFIVVILAIGIVYLPGHFLVYDEQPQPADVIIVLAGDRGNRTERGVELWRQGYAPYLMVSGSNVYNNKTNIAVLMKEHALELGVPEQAVIVETYADSTYQNAVFTKNMMQKYKLQSAIIVSSNYHMQRVKFLYEREFKGTGIQLTYCAAQDPIFNPDRWWANNKSAMITITEYIKFVGYAARRNE